MRINIAGDFYLSKNIDNPNEIIEDIQHVFKHSDYNIVNLESPITKDKKVNKILKVGPHLNGHHDSIAILSKLNINLVTLANNHILDYGEIGLIDTFNQLDENKISRIGAGRNIQDASKPITVIKDDFKIAFLNFTENEWSIAGESNPGANPLDIIENIKEIKLVKQHHDFVICIIHGGHEHYHLPSPRMVKQYRYYAENGADAVICHHTHCISGFEIHKNIPIFYSLGNFIFTKKSKHKSWYYGLIIQLKIEKDKCIRFELLPIIQDKKNYVIRLLSHDEKQKIINEIFYLNKIILNHELLKANWDLFLLKHKSQYINNFSIINLFSSRYIRAALKKLYLNKLLMRKNNLKEILNNIQCEAHIDACKEIIRAELSKKNY